MNAISLKLRRFPNQPTKCYLPVDAALGESPTPSLGKAALSPRRNGVGDKPVKYVSGEANSDESLFREMSYFDRF